MGGKCFRGPGTNGEPGLHVPRMSPTIYHIAKLYCIDLLIEDQFEHAEVPMEAPEKADHGDVDMLVSGPKSNEMMRALNSPSADITKLLVECLTPRLQAARSEWHPHHQIISFAIPFSTVSSGSLGENHPAQASKQMSAEQEAELDTLITEEAHFQIDLHVCPSRANLDYTLLTMAHGDTCNILSVSMRKIGLTVLPTGLGLNLDHELPKIHGKPIRIILSQDVSAILDFLGLDEAAWRHGFQTQAEVFGWIAAGRLFQRFARESNKEKSKVKNRAMFRIFAAEWLPDNPHAGVKPPIDRNQVLQEALDRFDKWGEYQGILSHHEAKAIEQEFWERVLTIVEPNGQARTIRALHRWVAFETRDDGSQSNNEEEPHQFLGIDSKRPVVRKEAEVDVVCQPNWTSDSGMTEEALLNWVKEHWEHVRMLEKQRDEQEKERRKEQKQKELLVESAKETMASKEAATMPI